MATIQEQLKQFNEIVKRRGALPAPKPAPAPKPKTPQQEFLGAVSGYEPKAGKPSYTQQRQRTKGTLENDMVQVDSELGNNPKLRGIIRKVLYNARATGDYNESQLSEIRSNAVKMARSGKTANLEAFVSETDKIVSDKLKAFEERAVKREDWRAEQRYLQGGGGQKEDIYADLKRNDAVLAAGALSPFFFSPENLSTAAAMTKPGEGEADLAGRMLAQGLQEIASNVRRPITRDVRSAVELPTGASELEQLLNFAAPYAIPGAGGIGGALARGLVTDLPSIAYGIKDAGGPSGFVQQMAGAGAGISDPRLSGQEQFASLLAGLGSVLQVAGAPALAHHTYQGVKGMRQPVPRELFFTPKSDPTYGPDAPLDLVGMQKRRQRALPGRSPESIAESGLQGFEAQAQKALPAPGKPKALPRSSLADTPTTKQKRVKPAAKPQVEAVKIATTPEAEITANTYPNENTYEAWKAKVDSGEAHIANAPKEFRDRINQEKLDSVTKSRNAESIPANLRVGQRFAGRIIEFTLQRPDGTYTVEARSPSGKVESFHVDPAKKHAATVIPANGKPKALPQSAKAAKPAKRKQTVAWKPANGRAELAGAEETIQTRNGMRVTVSTARDRTTVRFNDGKVEQRDARIIKEGGRELAVVFLPEDRGPNPWYVLDRKTGGLVSRGGSEAGAILKAQWLLSDTSKPKPAKFEPKADQNYQAGGVPDIRRGLKPSQKPAQKEPWQMTREEYAYHVDAPKPTFESLSDSSAYQRSKMSERALNEMLKEKRSARAKARIKYDAAVSEWDKHTKEAIASGRLTISDAFDTDAWDVLNDMLTSRGIEVASPFSIRKMSNADKSVYFERLSTDLRKRPVQLESPNTKKERWEITRKEYWKSDYAKSDPNKSKISDHKKAVQKAISEGKPVPAEVLADYPDLDAEFGAQVGGSAGQRGAGRNSNDNSTAESIKKLTDVLFHAWKSLPENKGLKTKAKTPERQIELIVRKSGWRVNKLRSAHSGSKYLSISSPIGFDEHIIRISDHDQPTGGGFNVGEGAKMGDADYDAVPRGFEFDENELKAFKEWLDSFDFDGELTQDQLYSLSKETVPTVIKDRFPDIRADVDEYQRLRLRNSPYTEEGSAVLRDFLERTNLPHRAEAEVLAYLNAEYPGIKWELPPWIPKPGEFDIKPVTRPTPTKAQAVQKIKDGLKKFTDIDPDGPHKTGAGWVPFTEGQIEGLKMVAEGAWELAKISGKSAMDHAFQTMKSHWNPTMQKWFEDEFKRRTTVKLERAANKPTEAVEAPTKKDAVAKEAKAPPTNQKVPPAQASQAYAETLRKNLGLPDITKGKKTLASMVESPRAKEVDANAASFAREWLNDTKRPITDEETAGLARAMNRLNTDTKRIQNEHMAAIERGDTNGAARLDAQLSIVLDDLNDITRVVHRTGTEWGLSGVARRLQLQKDYSTGGLTYRLSKAVKRKASAAELKEAAGHAQSVADAEIQFNKKVEEAVAARLKGMRSAPRAKGNRIFTEDRYKAAVDRINRAARGEEVRMAAGLDPQAMSDLITIVGYHVESGIRTLPELLGKAKELGLDKADERDVALATHQVLSEMDATRAQVESKKATLATLRKEVKDIVDPSILEKVNAKIAEIDAEPMANHPKEYWQSRYNEVNRLLRELNRGKGIGEDVYARLEDAIQDPEVSKARIALQRRKADAEAWLNAKEWESQSGLRKAYELAVEAVNIPRVVLASGDLSAPGRQGLILLLANPKRSVAAFRDQFRAIKKAGAEKVLDGIMTEKRYDLARDAKLAIMDVTHSGLFPTEDQFISRFAGKLPIVAQSDRAYSAFLSRIRMDWFTHMVDALEKSGQPVSLKEAKEIAGFVNIATGRGNLGKFETHGNTLAKLMFSARYNWSRIQYITGTPIWKSKSKRVQREILKTYGQTALGYAGLAAALTYGLGLSIGNDPTRGDIGRAIEGIRRYDITSGLSQYITLGARLFEGLMGNIRGDEKQIKRGMSFDKGKRLIRGKLTPTLGIATDFSINQGKDMFTGKKMGFWDVARKLLLPIGVSQIIENKMEGKPLSDTAKESTAEFFGIGARTWDTLPSSKKKAPPPKKQEPAYIPY